MSANPKDVIAETDALLLQTYASQPVVMERGEGMYAWDSEGKKYLDFAAGIAVASLGHAHAGMLETINEQASKMMICQASYATDPKLAAAKLLIETSCFDLAFFCNSGTESVEAALKCARKWAFDNKNEGAHEIIAFRKSFHGRTLGAASVTEKCHVQPFFGPYIPGVKFAEFNDIESVRALVSDKTAAVIVEPVQGEGGVTPADAGFMKALRELCSAEKICLIFDEVQVGFGRMGTLHAYESFGVEPDIACWAKGMGGGFPVGAMVAKEEFGRAIVVGTHGTTYGGNLLACAVAARVMEEIMADGFLDNVRACSDALQGGLEDLKRSSNAITDIRGKGLMIGVDTVFDIKALLGRLQENGLMATQAGQKTLRLTPPLIAELSHVDEALGIFKKTLGELDG